MPGEAMTVLQVLPALQTGGVERGTLEMTQAIAAAGGRALVASAGGGMVAQVQAAGGRHITLPLQGKDPFRLWRNAARLEQLIRAERVSLVHARSRAPAWSAWLAARRAGVAFLTTWHGLYSETLPLKRQYNAVMARGDRVIAISTFIAQQIAARHGLGPDRLRVIPRGVDPRLFDPAAVDAARLRQLALAWRLPRGAPVVLLPARLTRWKGQAVLIQALPRLAAGDAIAVLVGADQGRSRYVAELRSLARQLGVADRLRFAGHCDDMPAALALADVVVNPSIAPEAFGRAVIEAQAMARPVIASDHGGAAETIVPGVSGWRIPPGDAAALAAAIDQVLASDGAARAEFGAAARRSVLAHYTTEAMQQATLAVYRELLDASREEQGR